MATTATEFRNSSEAKSAQASEAKASPATVTTPTSDTTANSTDTPAVKAARKPRAKPEGLSISFQITDPAEIATLNKLAASDRRTPENYVSLLTYKHLIGHAASSATESAAGVK